MWFAYGPADTSFFTPVYSGTTGLPDDWSRAADFTRVTRGHPQWEFRLVNALTNALNYQSAIKDVRGVIEPGEKRLLSMQTAIEQMALAIYRKHGAAAVEKFVTEYAANSMRQAGYTYRELVDYLMFQYLTGSPEVAPRKPPNMAAPQIPFVPGEEGRPEQNDQETEFK